MDKITLTDENNKEVEFKIEDTFGVDDKNYAALSPNDEDFVVIFEMIEDSEGINFKVIENNQELNEVIKIYEDMKED